MRRARDAAWKTWLAAALAVWLLLAESFSLTHLYDSAAHASGQPCTLCVSAASFAAGAVSVPTHFEPAITPSFVVVATGIAFLSAVPIRRYARGPPVVSFAL
jgi:hypothetical protein